MIKSSSFSIATIGLVTIVTLTIGAWTWPHLPKLVDYGETGPRNSHYRVTSQDCESKSLDAVGNEAKRMRRAHACHREAEEYRRSINELIQQVRSANSAEAQVKIASQQLLTGWIQAIGGFLTLVAAGFAAWFARRAAIETQKGAFEASRSANAALIANRAWLKFEHFIVQNINIKGEDVEITASYKLKNIGRSPASIQTSVIVDALICLMPYNPLWAVERYAHDKCSRWYGHDGPTLFPDEALERTITLSTKFLEEMIFPTGVSSIEKPAGWDESFQNIYLAVTGGSVHYVYSGGEGHTRVIATISPKIAKQDGHVQSVKTNIEREWSKAD